MPHIYYDSYGHSVSATTYIHKHIICAITSSSLYIMHVSSWLDINDDFDYKNDSIHIEFLHGNYDKKLNDTFIIDTQWASHAQSVDWTVILKKYLSELNVNYIFAPLTNNDKTNKNMHRINNIDSIKRKLIKLYTTYHPYADIHIKNCL